ncbi:hypothetical protein EXU48_23870 [Occultella glacieicola]|uniref:Uncharacterized protein n=1 Tax=Occultella glacieicola TaxID=2518684 RepID=A0ABY2DWT6_9MICO|nr:hypothetical protein [Occultella glacieicola]TDE88162.1 hypothetical protein EXU48_23870 [Occultella glacieicola]
MTEPRAPIAVQVWVSRPRVGVVRTDGLATAWTPRAVRVRLVDEHDRTEEVWVWANAVERA